MGLALAKNEKARRELADKGMAEDQGDSAFTQALDRIVTRRLRDFP